MNTSEFVHDAMPAAQRLHVEVRAGPAFETLIGLSALTSAEGDLGSCTPELRRAIARVGGRSSELWLHLLGLALERPGDLAGAVEATSGQELRRHLAGVRVPAWQALVGREALEATARGDPALLGHPSYYAGEARESLELLLPLSPAETKRRVLAVLRRYEGEVLDRGVVAALEREAGAKRGLAVPPDELIELACPGYRYEPEPELGTVVLVPHVAARPWLLLCQHERKRIICYPLPEAHDLDRRALALGRALGDGHRVRMLRRLAAGEASLAELAETAATAKSTAHHHLAQLRAAGLVTMTGNARSYRFALRGEGLAEARRLLAELGQP
jgi:DNA-binding transcriptional ArsR family regulator